MENASKALLIAGAILICILLIAIGMYIYQSAQGTIQTAAGQMGQQEKEMYNSMIKKYIGRSKKGSDVKLMIDAVISQNNQYVNESGKFISVANNGVSGYPTADGGVNDKCNLANVYTNQNAVNNQANIDAASKEMRALAQKVSAGKNYAVTEFTTDGIIYAVVITPLNADGSVTEPTAVPGAKDVK